jgi:NitT/TauT family transport system permease protein
MIFCVLSLDEAEKKECKEMKNIQRNSVRKSVLSFLSVPLILILIWECLVIFKLINGLYFPRPSDIVRRLLVLSFHEKHFSMHIMYSFFRFTAGYALAAPLALILGVGAALNGTLKKAILPLFSLTYPIPKIAVFPLLMVIFGIGDAPKIAIVAIGVFYLMFYHVFHSASQLHHSYFDVAKIYKIPSRTIMISIIARGIFPDILNGSKLGMGYGLVMVVAGEFVAATNGIGFFMWNAWDQFRIIDMYASLVVISLMGIVIFSGHELLYNHIKWLKNKTNAS